MREWEDENRVPGAGKYRAVRAREYARCRIAEYRFAVEDWRWRKKKLHETPCGLAVGVRLDG